MKTYENIWNENMLTDIKKLDGQLYVYDRWLEEFKEYIENSRLPIIDLGCGIGNDTLYLKNLGKQVLSVDFSLKALNILKENVPESKTLKMDLENEWLLKKNCCDLMIANLSLHYFDTDKTLRIIKCIKETIVPEGILIFRLNSTNDDNYGADSSEEIEKHFYKANGINKRFFDKEDIYTFFRDFEILYLEEKSVLTQIHQKPKKVWAGVLRNKKHFSNFD